MSVQIQAFQDGSGQDGTAVDQVFWHSGVTEYSVLHSSGGKVLELGSQGPPQVAVSLAAYSLASELPRCISSAPAGQGLPAGDVRLV